MIKGVVFDRDGTLIKYVPYLFKPSDVVIYPGVIAACHLLKARNIQIFIATNQSGIGRGYFSEEDYRVVEHYIEGLLMIKGAQLLKHIIVPFTPEHGVGEFKKESHDRKPNPGMIQRIMREFNFASDELIMVGDSAVDIQAAKNAGVLSGLVRTGNGVQTELVGSCSPSYIGDDVLSIVNHFILDQ